MNNIGNGNKMLSVEDFEQKLNQQKEPMKISLTNPMINFDNHPGISPISPMASSPMHMNQNIDYNQMKKQREFYQSSLANHGLKSKSSNSSLNGSKNNLFHMNSEQTLLPSPKFNPHPPLNRIGSVSSMDKVSLSGNKYLNHNGSELTLDMHSYDGGSYELGTPIGNPMMGNKLMMNPAFNSSQSSFNSFGGAGFRDESFDEDSDLDDFLDGPKRKPTETEALADFLKNTGPDMLGTPQSPIDSQSKKKRGSLFKFKKGKKKEKKPSALSEEISNNSSNGNAPKHTPIVINYPGAENQPNLSGQPQQPQQPQQQINMMNSSYPNQFAMNNGANLNVPSMPTNFNSLKSNGSISSIHSYQQQNGMGSPFIMNLKSKQEVPGSPHFNNIPTPTSQQQQQQLQLQQQLQMQQQQMQMQAQNMSVGQKAPGENFPFNKAGMGMNFGTGSNTDLSTQSPSISSQDPRILNKNGMNMNVSIPTHSGSLSISSSNSNSNSVNINNNKLMNNLSISTINNAKNFIENATANDNEISPSIKNRIVENLESLSLEHGNYDLDEDEPRPRVNAAPMSMVNVNDVNIPNSTNSNGLPNKTIVEVEDVRNHQQIATSTSATNTTSGDEYYDQGLLDDDDDDDYFSESDSELIRNTRFNANMVGDEFYYDKSFDSPIQRPPPDPNRKTVQFNPDVKRISHIEYT
ncbi:hypothetical protein H8356DRAFT_1731443, partial [Neocallimastix lanati (nom. inval.)]